MPYLPYLLEEDFQGKGGCLQCREDSKEVCHKPFETITFQRIQRHLCTSVCSLLLLLRR